MNYASSNLGDLIPRRVISDTAIRESVRTDDGMYNKLISRNANAVAYIHESSKVRHITEVEYLSAIS